MGGKHSKPAGWALAAILGLASLSLAGAAAAGDAAAGDAAAGDAAAGDAAAGDPAAGDAAAGDAAQGEKAFRRLCSACHAPTPGVTRLGPTLHGVVGRRAGAVAGFSYSAPYAAGQVVWTPEVLYQYLKDPKTYMPGSRMNFVGIRSEAERADVVAYLGTLNK